jgi:hypothetical protein|tara:strand:+ start:241 stop:423 length:183 start_codon:yes stop_codon:yes gene_type:complete
MKITAGENCNKTNKPYKVAWFRHIAHGLKENDFIFTQRKMPNHLVGTFVVFFDGYCQNIV